jgi:hypothetical protein
MGTLALIRHDLLLVVIRSSQHMTRLTHLPRGSIKAILLSKALFKGCISFIKALSSNASVSRDGEA